MANPKIDYDEIEKRKSETPSESYRRMKNQWRAERQGLGGNPPTPIYKNPLDQAKALQYVPFELNREKYPDVEETPYGFIYNVGNQSITDVAEQNARLFNKPATKSDGFTLTVDGDEVFYPDFDSAYKAAKGIK